MLYRRLYDERDTMQQAGARQTPSFNRADVIWKGHDDRGDYFRDVVVEFRNSLGNDREFLIIMIIRSTTTRGGRRKNAVGRFLDHPSTRERGAS